MEMVPLRERHVYDFLDWQIRTDPRDRMYNFVETEATVGDWYRWKTNDPRDLYFAIVVDGVSVGYTGLKDRSSDGKCAEVGIVIGGGKTGKGYGKSALERLIAYGFETMKLERIALEVLPWNDRARRVYTGLGFKPVGQIFRPVDLSRSDINDAVFDPYRDKIRAGRAYVAVMVDRMELRKGEWQGGI